jgi:flagellar hook-basal body complex protein FliE
MDDLRIARIASSPLTETAKSGSKDALADFGKALSQSMGDVNKMLNQADESAQEMVTGKKDIHEAMISMEEANISLRMMTQVRNKILAAYEEIMRMQF